MDKDNRKYRFCFIDYMWYVAEIWHEREHNNLNGRMLLFFCWLFAILVPLGTPLMFRYFSWIVAFAIVMILCFLPTCSVSSATQPGGVKHFVNITER